MAKCRDCGQNPCDSDCGELRLIYREQQREKLRDIELSDEEAEAIQNAPEAW